MRGEGVWEGRPRSRQVSTAFRQQGGGEHHHCQSEDIHPHINLQLFVYNATVPECFRVIEKIGRQGLGCDVHIVQLAQSSKAFFLGRISFPSHMETKGLSPNSIQSICFRVIWRGGGGWGAKAREACSVYLGIVLVCSLGRVKGAAFLAHHDPPFCV